MTQLGLIKVASQISLERAGRARARQNTSLMVIAISEPSDGRRGSSSEAMSRPISAGARARDGSQSSRARPAR